MKPSEVKAVAAALEQDHETAADAAKAAIKALEDIRRDVRQLAIVRWEGFPIVVGGFSTEGQVKKALQKGLGGPKWTVGYLRTPESFDATRDALEGVTGARDCPACGHPQVAHINQKWKPYGSKEVQEPRCMGCECRERF